MQHGVVALLGFGRGDVSDGLQEPSVVEPIDPFEGGELDGLEAAPWPAPMDHLGLVETVDGFGEGIVIGISDTADRRLDTSFSQALGVVEITLPGRVAGITWSNKPETKPAGGWVKRITVVCTENSNPDVVMVKPAEDRV